MRFFFKLFITFWITLILLAGIIAWTAHHLRDNFEQEMPDFIVRQMQGRTDLADILSRNGVARVREFLASREDSEQFFVVDEAGEDILGRPFSLHHHRVMQDLRERNVFDPQIVKTPNGRSFRIFLFPPRPSLLHILVAYPWTPVSMILFSGMTVFLLALHFTRPIQRLRETSMKLAEGDLGARYDFAYPRIADELSGLGRDFNFMAERLDQLFHAHKRLIRDISHELRSPLARMRVAIELVEPKDADSQENLSHLGADMERLDELIGQILALSRHETVSPLGLKDWIELTGLIEALVADSRYEVAQMEREVVLHLCDEVIIKANGLQLRSALENVVRNALRHTPDHGKVTITVVKDEKYAIVTVSDEGEGVAEDQLELIFQPFYRVGEDRDRERGGFGLGLAIASQVVQHHGGAIFAANRVTGGLIITIRLPITESDVVH